MLSKVIPFRKKRNNFPRAKSHDDVYRRSKSQFSRLLSSSHSKLVSSSSNKLVSNSNNRLSTSSRSTIGNDDNWPFKRPVKKLQVYGNSADRLQSVGDRLCNYGASDLNHSYYSNRSKHLVHSNGYLSNNGLRPSHSDKVLRYNNGNLDEGKERRRSVIAPPSANLGRYMWI